MLLKDLIELPENPYPEDIFKEPSPEKYALINKKLEEAGITPDGYNGSNGRRVWKNLIEQIGNISVCLDVGKIAKAISKAKLSTYEIVTSTRVGVRHIKGKMCKEIAQHLADNIKEIILETK